MISRRGFISGASLATVGLLPMNAFSLNSKHKSTIFKFCLNTSTIRGQNPGLKAYIDIASRVGFDGVELWVRDVREFLESGSSVEWLRDYILQRKLTVEGAIGFAPWIKGSEGMAEMKSDMELMASIGCKRIAAPASGFGKGEVLNPIEAANKYRELLEYGLKIGIRPCLEFWGTSPVLNHMGQVLEIAAHTNHSKAAILADVYHMFRGGSGFDTLRLLNGNVMELFHMNDYPGNLPREEQADKDRVYPGDGVAPLKDILQSLKEMGGEKVLSLELFNPVYWEQDMAEVAKTGLAKMKQLVSQIT